MSAGKNTYTYDAHTYHTKVPPQGIAELLNYYLPEGGLVLDPFAGSGMTGVAARVAGLDCIQYDLSPAACFIAGQFAKKIDPAMFSQAVEAVLDEHRELRRFLYTTTCRECGKPTEILYTVWSYRVICGTCAHEFLLWNHCRSYGSRVKEHKILREFPCPSCERVLRKSTLRRTSVHPVLVGYMCCGSRSQERTHEPNESDRELISRIERSPPTAHGFFPEEPLPFGVNLRQPIFHGLDSVDKFYSIRNLAALSNIWRSIHRIQDDDLAAQLAFVFTSLYQRVSRLSEFRFWGGSGNTARFNVPFIFNEANVYLTFARKARTIQDHLESTAAQYQGAVLTGEGSATNLEQLPNGSMDLVFTDPPFGSNINYSEMNFLWESWLGRFTRTEEEAIVSKVQGKSVDDYGRLLSRAFAECFRVLRNDHWMLVVFMNSSAKVWGALRDAITQAGFEIRQADVFDKQHGTFKHFVSENTAGYDLILHCLKRGAKASNSTVKSEARLGSIDTSVKQFLEERDLSLSISRYLHVSREEELDFRMLYSEWLKREIAEGGPAADFSEFRRIVTAFLKGED